MYRVIQWATGAMGKASLRAMIDHPELELAGVYVYGSKAGRDAGDIAQRPATGVLATNDVDEILALEADVVVHAARLGPYGSHDDDIIALLASGKNVLSINGYSCASWSSPERLAALEQACADGGTTLMSAGLNPGVAAEQLAVVASGMCSELDGVEIVESIDCRDIQQAAYLFDVLGFGADPEANDPNDEAWGPTSALNGMYTEALVAMATHLGITIDEVETEHRLFAATQDVETAAGVIAAGTVSHTNWRWIARGGGKTFGMSIHWYAETTHLDDPEPAMWSIHLEGQPGVRISMELEKRPGDPTRMSAEQYAVGGTIVNSVPVIVAAPTGVSTRAPLSPYWAGATRPV